MRRTTFEKTADYKKSVEVLKAFVDEVLGGDIEKLRTFCMGDVKSYVGDIDDPDMYLIVQAIYILLWGDSYDLTFEKMGAWDIEGTFAYRGDTMNSFGSIFGKKSPEREFGYRAKYFGADKKTELWKKIEDFHKMYHWIGNFIVIPNRGSYIYGINGARANYCEGMRDYFDWFLITLAKYQDKVKAGEKIFSDFEEQLQLNPEYDPSFMDISEWEERFFLENYFENGQPKLLFSTPLERRLLITDVAEKRKNDRYYQDEEYLALMEDYLDKTKLVIEYRTNKMVDCLINILGH